MTNDELLVEGVDYYVEDGFMVFTEVYLQRRGFCCRSGCRHCPYGFVKEQDNTDDPSSSGEIRKSGSTASARS